MGSPRYSLTANEWKKNLRDLGFAIGGALLTAIAAWLTGFGAAHPDAYWVPTASSMITGVIVIYNRWQRDASQTLPDVLPETEPAPPSDWKMS